MILFLRHLPAFVFVPLKLSFVEKKGRCILMFEQGEYVIYGCVGLCKVSGITTMDMDGIPKDKLYYSLQPYYQKERKLFTAVDSTKTLMRRILSKEEADDLIEKAANLEILWFDNDKVKENKYKEIIKNGDCSQLVQIMKTVHVKSEERKAAGKKMPAVDEKYYKIAGENLYSELSVALGMGMAQTEQYMSDRIFV